MIRELRILPPLAFGRFGASTSPMDNYDVVPDPANPLGYRTLRPAPTLELDPATGEITREFTPARLAFTENRRVRPVAPFLELWALVGAELEPVTVELLAADGLEPADVSWRVHVANHKVFRRTGQDDDRVEADTREFSDHQRKRLDGQAINFWPGKTIPFGQVQYIKPNDTHPEIRLRFTPAAGFVYGSSRTAPGQGAPGDGNVRDVVYDGGRGTWLGYSDETTDIPVTAPAGIYA
jgi:hypothetical protein